MEALFDRGLDRRPARRAADRGARAADAGGHDPRARRDRRRRRRPTSCESPSRRSPINAVMAGCQPEYLPCGARRRRGGVHRRVQHPRRAGHHDAGRAGARSCNGPDPPGHRHEPRRQRARPGQPRQPRRSAGPLQLVVRNVGGGRPGERRPGHPRQPRQARRSASPRTRRARRGSRWRVARASTPGADAVTLFPGEGPRCVVDQLARDARGAGRHVRRVPAHRAPPEARRSASTPSSSSAPSTPGCSPRPAGTATGCWPSSTPGCSCPAPRSCAGAGGMAEGRARVAARRDRCRKFRPGGLLHRPRRWWRRVVLCHHRRLGQRRHRQPAGHAGDRVHA